MYECRKCGKRVKTLNGLHGHWRFKHGIELSTGEPVPETPHMRAITESLERIWRTSRDSKEFEAWRREKAKAERPRDYKMWRRMQERRRRR